MLIKLMGFQRQYLLDLVINGKYTVHSIIIGVFSRRKSIITAKLTTIARVTPQCGVLNALIIHFTPMRSSSSFRCVICS